MSLFFVGTAQEANLIIAATIHERAREAQHNRHVPQVRRQTKEGKHGDFTWFNKENWISFPREGVFVVLISPR